jgi:hypothetical protein
MLTMRVTKGGRVVKWLEGGREEKGGEDAMVA